MSKNALYNVETFFKAQGSVIETFNDFSSMISVAKYETINTEGIKILTLKQIIQWLTIPLSQVKVGFTSENLLNQIRWKIFFLFWEKEIAKKIYKAIINSTQFELCHTKWILDSIQTEYYIYEFWK